MFEIPDDDNFWEELPLDDITNSGDKSLNIKGQSCTKVPHESSTLNRQTVTLSSELADPYPDSSRKRQRLDSGHHRTNLTENNGKLNIKSVNRDCPAVSSPVLVPDTQTTSVSVSHNGPVRPANVQTPCTNTARSHETPKRCKRKFPGPAGLLPKLQGLKHSPDLSEIVKSPSSVHQEPQNSEVLPSSQSEDSFNELPWQSLIKDLGNDGQKYLKEFSIANSLQKSKKKLLPRGKVPFVMGIIETVDWQGSAASVVLKDKSGKVKGSVHGDIMKEYQEDLQVNSVLVLRQVGVISPTTRNHYLNITPSNIVTIYSNKAEGIKKVNCVNLPLYSIVESLQKDLDQELVNTMNRINSLPKTPKPCATSGVGQERTCQTPNLNQSMSTPTSYRFKTPQRGVNPRVDTPGSDNRSMAATSTPLRSPGPGAVYGNRTFTPRACVPKTPTPGANQQGFVARTPTPGSSQQNCVARTPTRGVNQHGFVNRAPGTNLGQMGQFNRPPVSVCSNNVFQPCTQNNRINSGFTSQNSQMRTENSLIHNVATGNSSSTNSHCRTPARTCTNTTVASPSLYRFNKSVSSMETPRTGGCEVSPSNCNSGPLINTNTQSGAQRNTGINSQSLHSANSTYNCDNRFNTASALSSIHNGNSISNNQSVSGNSNGQKTAPCMTTNSLSVTSTPVRNGFKFRSTKKSPNLDPAPSLSVSVTSTESTSNRMDSSKGFVHDSRNVNMTVNKNEFDNKPDSHKSYQSQSGIGQNFVDLHKGGGNHGNTDSMKKVPCFTVNSDWHDDLSDDLLSQLSEEME